MEIPLTRLKANTDATVVRLMGHGSTFQRRLRNMGIREGKTLKVVACYPFSGPLVVEVDGREITLGRGIAQRIMVSVG
jgi:ferrous iron transport protein A